MNIVRLYGELSVSNFSNMLLLCSKNIMVIMFNTVRLYGELCAVNFSTRSKNIKGLLCFYFYYNNTIILVNNTLNFNTFIFYVKLLRCA